MISSLLIAHWRKGGHVRQFMSDSWHDYSFLNSRVSSWWLNEIRDCVASYYHWCLKSAQDLCNLSSKMHVHVQVQVRKMVFPNNDQNPWPERTTPSKLFFLHKVWSPRHASSTNNSIKFLQDIKSVSKYYPSNIAPCTHAQMAPKTSCPLSLKLANLLKVQARMEARKYSNGSLKVSAAAIPVWILHSQIQGVAVTVAFTTASPTSLQQLRLLSRVHWHQKVLLPRTTSTNGTRIVNSTSKRLPRLDLRTTTRRVVHEVHGTKPRVCMLRGTWARATSIHTEGSYDPRLHRLQIPYIWTTY